jgi:hypothetical protein
VGRSALRASTERGNAVESTVGSTVERRPQRRRSRSTSDDSSQILVGGIAIVHVDVDLIVDRARCRRRRRTTLSPPSRLDVDRRALRASTEPGKAVEVDGGVRRPRTASLPSTSTVEVDVEVDLASRSCDESSEVDVDVKPSTFTAATAAHDARARV